MTAAMLPFRELLKPSTPFEWTDKLSDAFTASKDDIKSMYTHEEGINAIKKRLYTNNPYSNEIHKPSKS